MPPDSRIDRNFVLQQGFPAPSPATCRPLTAALVFQPRVVALLLVVGCLVQSAPVFLGVAGLLWWSALIPSLSPFDALYRLVSRFGGPASNNRTQPTLS